MPQDLFGRSLAIAIPSPGSGRPLGRLELLAARLRRICELAGDGRVVDRLSRQEPADLALDEAITLLPSLASAVGRTTRLGEAAEPAEPARCLSPR